MSSKSQSPDEIQEAVDYVKQTARDGAKKFNETADDVEAFIKEHPFAAVAIAAGLGYFIARLTARTR